MWQAPASPAEVVPCADGVLSVLYEDLRGPCALFLVVVSLLKMVVGMVLSMIHLRPPAAAHGHIGCFLSWGW